MYEEHSEECLAEIVKPKMTFALKVSQPLMNPLKYESENLKCPYGAQTYRTTYGKQRVKQAKVEAS